ncbi:MAG: aminopeptidase P family protein [Aureispira sp.]|nr:aminopeptidase P family protein [Aureispira sp.]
MDDTQHRLLEAQNKAFELFKTAEQEGFFQAGQTEDELNTRLYELAEELLGIKKYWHKRIVRSGENTLYPYKENPPNLMIQADDILFFDFGPVFEDWEADIGYTYVLGNDPNKLQLKADITIAWEQGKIHFDKNPKITGAQFYAYTQKIAKHMGWEFGNIHCGHLIGQFPHEKILGDDVESYIHPDNHTLMHGKDKFGNDLHWIYEIHFIDRKQKIGGFIEKLLTVPYSLH